jgi:organic radical activating enzyme
MLIKGIVDVDFSNYKKPSMFIIFPFCTFKCDKEAGCAICQNSALAQEPNIEIGIEELVQRYIDNPITSAIVCGGLEPMDSLPELHTLVRELRKHTDDDIVIYTGYKEDEYPYQWSYLERYPNIIIKFGRFIPNQEKHYDAILGVDLASSNQYARRIS